MPPNDNSPARFFLRIKNTDICYLLYPARCGYSDNQQLPPDNGHTPRKLPFLRCNPQNATFRLIAPPPGKAMRICRDLSIIHQSFANCKCFLKKI